MRKLQLDPENLVVEGFTTTAHLGGRGTVRGHTGIATCSGTDSLNNCADTVVMTGFDIASATGCNQCICPNQVGGG